MKMPQGDLRSPVLSSLPVDSRPVTCFLLTPLQSALTENARITPLESALTKLLDLKSFRIRTYEKRWGEVPKDDLPNPGRQPRSMPTGPLQYWAHGATIGP